MRRIDAIGITLGIFLAGGLIYLGLQLFGLNGQDAGIWSQVMLVVGLVGWLATYLFRAGTKNMTYHQQREEYEQAFFEKRLNELTPEELAKLQAEMESDD
ncbi:MAG: DUF3007 family protein [Sphaerospermopsis sp. SIO1G2]|nr:DUF3007 family protein [Sphaerospermopsis sp. SIO1G1]NET70506.1 DUF3007 family protein [Sphaerospermopsis sp. SIO1G2]